MCARGHRVSSQCASSLSFRDVGPAKDKSRAPSSAPRNDGGDARDAGLSKPTRAAAVTPPSTRALAPLSGSVARAAPPTLRFVADGAADIQLCATRECASPQLFANATSPFTIPSTIPSVSAPKNGVWYWRLVRGGKPLTPLWSFTLLPSRAPAHVRPPRGIDVDGDGHMDIVFRGALLRGRAAGLAGAPLDSFPLAPCTPPPGQVGCPRLRRRVVAGGRRR